MDRLALQSPRLGLVSPADFIPAAERIGLPSEAEDARPRQPPPDARICTDALTDRCRFSAAECEAAHNARSAGALFKEAGLADAKAQPMNMRRMMSWWFRVVLSGRFLERFLHVERGERPESADASS